MREPAHTDLAQLAYTRTRIAHWDKIAAGLDSARDWSSAYHARLREVYRSAVAPNQRVLEIGCGEGNLLDALEPSFGLGVDFSGGMVQRASRRHPDLRFVQADVHLLELGHEAFDVIVLADVVNDLWDLQIAFSQMPRVS